MPKWISLLVFAFVGYILWRKFGHKVTGFVTKVAA